MSVIGKEMRIDGNCFTTGQLRLEGQVAGDVTAGGIELTGTGAVDGDLAAPAGDQQARFIVGGRVAGSVKARYVEVRQGGSILGGLVAEEAVIQGSVEGSVVASKRLALDETAVVEGDVLTKRLSLKEGGQVNGNIRMGEEAATSTKPVERTTLDSEPRATPDLPREAIAHERGGVLKATA